MTKSYGRIYNYGIDTLLGDEPPAAEQDEAHDLRALEAEQDAHDATVEAESDEHTVLRHTKFYPLDPDTRGLLSREVGLMFMARL